MAGRAAGHDIGLGVEKSLFGCGTSGSSDGSEKDTGTTAPQVTTVDTSGDPDDGKPETPEATVVVSLGCLDSETTAFGLLSSARTFGYDDAYVKYSGEYVG